MDEARLRQILHDCFAEVIDSLWVPHIHNQQQVQNMSDRIHKKIDTLEDE